VHEVTGEATLRDIADRLLHALDADVQEAAARKMFGLSKMDEPTEEQLQEAAKPLKEKAIAPLMQAPPFGSSSSNCGISSNRSSTR